MKGQIFFIIGSIWFTIGCKNPGMSPLRPMNVSPTSSSSSSSYITETTTVAPSITAQPASQSITAVGHVTTFSVAVSGTAPFTYQWMKNGVNITGATASTYALDNTQLSAEGSYSVQVTNSAGSVTSSVSVLTVEPIIQNGVINVIDFGAKCDGTDDTAALRRAAAAVPSSGATLNFPKATCVIKGTIYLNSHTHIAGNGGTLRAGLPWSSDHQYGYAMLENVNHAAISITDTDISVDGLIIDYGDFGPVAVAGGGKHAVRFVNASNISVTNNIFYLRGGEDAVAGLGVNNMVVQKNEAYDFTNCAYDFWFGPSNVKVIDNIATTSASAQMVNFNPERTSGDSTGMVASDFEMSNNVFTGTGTAAIPIQIEPLGPGTMVENASITKNILNNVYLVLRGNVQNATIDSNEINNVRGGATAIVSYPFNNGVANSIVVSNNKIQDPQTQASELGVLRLEAQNSKITGNLITGSNYLAAPIYYGSYNVQIQNNIISTNIPEGAITFVTVLYTGLLGRQPDASAVQSWGIQLTDDRQTCVQVATAFATSSEFVNRNLSDSDWLIAIYAGFLGRTPDQEGFNAWFGAMSNGGTSRSAVMDAFLSSQEFFDRCSGLGLH